MLLTSKNIRISVSRHLFASPGVLSGDGQFLAPDEISVHIGDMLVLRELTFGVPDFMSRV